MRASQFFLVTYKETPADAEVISHQLMLRAGMIAKLASGLYSWLPLGLRVLQKISQVVREEMNRAGALEVLLPAVHPAELWQETDRWATFGPLLLKMKDRNEREYCFGPTHEEVITDLVRGQIKSYKQLPLNLYQIQTKFRDEIRPRFGVMRAREFIMKDSYSFHLDDASLAQTYDTMYNTYCKIFSRLGLKYRAVLADTGSIGGSKSHEFQVLAESGEDVIFYSDKSDFAANLELLPNAKVGDASPDGQGTLKMCRGIEVGHIFQLGDKYSQAMNATVSNNEDEQVVMKMGCYGIGVSRIAAAAIEQNHDANGIIWPEPIAPFQISLVPINMHKSKRVRIAAERLYQELTNAGYEVLFDDRDERPGVLFAEMDLIGIPHRLVVSERGLDANTIEYKHRQNTESQAINANELLNFLRKV